MPRDFPASTASGLEGVRCPVLDLRPLEFAPDPIVVIEMQSSCDARDFLPLSRAFAAQVGDQAVGIETKGI